MQNLITVTPANVPAVLATDLLPLLESLGRRKFSDEEIGAEIDAVLETLKAGAEQLSCVLLRLARWTSRRRLTQKCGRHRTYDLYLSSLSPPTLSAPQSVEFWHDNAAKLLLQDKKALKLLLQVILHPTSPADDEDLVVVGEAAEGVKEAKRLAAAVGDLGSFLRECEGGKK